MNVKQGREIIEKYRLEISWVESEAGPFDRQPSPLETVNHLGSMLNEMEDFLNPELERDGDWDKFNRWLGFIQGVFWVGGDYTLNEMRDHNRT